jgi:hypothetical protein
LLQTSDESEKAERILNRSALLQTYASRRPNAEAALQFGGKIFAGKTGIFGMKTRMSITEKTGSGLL